MSEKHTREQKSNGKRCSPLPDIYTLIDKTSYLLLKLLSNIIYFSIFHITEKDGEMELEVLSIKQTGSAGRTRTYDQAVNPDQSGLYR